MRSARPPRVCRRGSRSSMRPFAAACRRLHPGRLEVFVGATGNQYERVRPILELLGTVRHVGGPGAGAAMKLVANLVLGAAIVTLGEALALGDALDLEPGLVLDALADSPIGPIVKANRASVESGDFTPSFKLPHPAKEPSPLPRPPSAPPPPPRPPPP